jgi:hypothetical protein
MCVGTTCVLNWDHLCWGHLCRAHVDSIKADYNSACRRRRGWDKLWEPTRLPSVLRICQTICFISN